MTGKKIALPSRIKIVEVSPRDGLQNEPCFVPTPIKIEFINRLARTGLQFIEVTSFVSPNAVPQLADHVEVYSEIDKPKEVHFSALVPNRTGMQKAIQAGLKEIAIFASASETFSQKNIRCSIAESLQRFNDVIALAKEHQIAVRGYVSCVLGCPYEGQINPEIVANLSEKLFLMGCHEISLGDTIGTGTPISAANLVRQVSNKVPIEQLAVHFHDTYGQALVNIYACLQEGIRMIDSSVAGLGGCPYAPGASGNVATEEVLYMLHGLGIQTGIDLPMICEAGKFMSEQLGRPSRSKVALALNTKNHYPKQFNGCSQSLKTR